MPDKLKEVCAYVRVSTDKQEELSPDSQIRLIKEYAAAHGMLLTKIYQEKHGISGSSADKRPAFQEMIATCKLKEHPYDAILLWKFSRFARNRDEATYYKSILRKKCNVDVISISEPIMEGMYGQLIEMVIEWSDEFYLYNLSGEVMRGMTQKAMQGGYNAKPPIGYRKLPGEDVPVVDPDTSLLVKRIFQMYVDGHKKSDIASILNREGIRTARGNPWENRTINYILENPFYIGKIRWNYYDRKKHERKSAKDVIIVDGKHEAIISLDTWSAAAKRLSQDHVKRDWGKKRGVAANSHWLSGMVKCSNCGASLGYSSSKNRPAQRPYFRCWKSGKGTCDAGKNIRETELITAVLACINDIAAAGIPYVYEVSASVPEEDTYTLLKKQLKSLEQKEKRVKEAYINGIDTLKEYKENKELLRETRAGIEKQIADLERPTPITKDSYKTVDLHRLLDQLQDDAVDYIAKGNALREVFQEFIYDAASDTLQGVLLPAIKAPHA